MDTNAWYALLAPLFLLLVATEALVARSRGRAIHRLPESLANVACGLGQILLGSFTGVAILALYAWFHARFALVRWPEGSLIPWVLALIGVDFLYYCWHRAQHRVPLLWAIHAVHHQSTAMNLTAGLRQPWISDLTAIPFYAPLPLLGVGEVPFFAAVGLLSVWQLSLHTELIDGRGPVSRLFNTASHHRVHHGRDDAHRDKNFGNLLIVWDRLCGTFAPETERVARYGTVEPILSWNPVWAQVQPALALVGSSGTPSAPDRPDRARTRWALLQFGLTGAVAILYLFEGKDQLQPAIAALVVTWIVASGAVIAGLLERRAWAVPCEVARLGALAIGAVVIAT